MSRTIVVIDSSYRYQNGPENALLKMTILMILKCIEKFY